MVIDMKNSIAKNVTRRVSTVLIIAALILFVASAWIVQHIIYNKSKSYSKSILSSYSDLIVNEFDALDIPIDEAHSDRILDIGDKMCRWYEVDFAYLLVPNDNGKGIRYVCVSQNKKFDKINPDDRYVGKKTDYVLTKDELEVWKGQREFSNSITKSKKDYEISTMTKISDEYGNTVLAGIDQSYNDVVKEIIKLFSMLAFIIVLVVLGVYLLVYVVIKRRVSKPAEILSKSMNEFITDGVCSSVTLKSKEDDEYSMIASAFNCMTKNINEYIKDINNLSREKERQKTELDIASQIQKGFLPKNHVNSDFYEVRTTMLPAKDVGGDFYYYMPLDDDNVLAVIADVSGKGISAALFMAVTLTLTVQYAKLNLSPAEILEKTNETLCGNNPTMLFATEFVGVYNSKTQEFTYSNAGHDIPYLLVNNEIKALDSAKGTLLGLFEDEKYSNDTVHLDVGDTLFLYTDGVTESADKDNKFFGRNRLESALKEFRESNAYNLISFIDGKLSEFSSGAEQHDDITMLTLTVKKTERMFLDFDTAEFSKIKDFILSTPIERSEQLKLCLCAEEWFINICSYAFPDGVPTNEKIEFSFILSDRIIMRFVDGGQQFNPLEHIINIDDYDIETQVGGLGNFITVSNTDDIFYKYENGKNILTLIRFYKN